MSPKRKFSDLDACDAAYATRNNAGDHRSPWSHRAYTAVPDSLPLSNMLDAVRELIDPDFHPQIEDFISHDDDDEEAEEPRFLKPLPSRVAREDVDYLQSRGALTIPETPLRNELLKAYVKWAYSSLPVLDLHSFLEAVATNAANANISLLLFQAVMFAGTAFIDINFLKAAGFKTRREARKAFFNNARLLYVLDCEDDRIAAIQSMLLMTYYYEKDESLQKDIWHWVGVCYTQAQSIGLHRDPTESSMGADVKRLRIRLWWCLYLRDRLIALALRRPMQINEDICNVPPLGLADFDIAPFHVAVDDIFPDFSYMGDPTLQRRLSVLFIEKVKLCQCLGRVLSVQYTPFNCPSGATRETTISLVARQASDAEWQRTSQELDTWMDDLPDEARFFVPPEKKEINNGDGLYYLNASMLLMLYHATCSALYRPRASASDIKSAGQETSEILTSVARKKIQYGAGRTATTVYSLRHLGLTRYLPTCALTVVTPAAVVHMTNLRSNNAAVRDKSTVDFRLCIDVMNELRDIYPAADYETEILEVVIQQLQQKHQKIPTSPVMMRKDNGIMQGGKHTQSISDLVTNADQNTQPFEQHNSSILVEGQTWDWSGNHHNWHQGQKHVDRGHAGRISIDVENLPFQSTQSNKARTSDEGISPRRLIAHNHGNEDDENADDGDYDFIGLLGSYQQGSSIPSFMDGRMIITGDLEKDLGFI